jgi:Flp pilus assembly protein TadD
VKTRTRSRPCPDATARLLALGLIAVTLLVFGQTLGFDFVLFDDDGYVLENTRLHQGWSLETVGWAFTTHYMSNWHPLTWLSYLVDFELHGLEPAGYHATNVLLHLLNTLLLFGWLRAATGAVWRSACVAALFAVHPLHVESVAWISERKDVLSASFGLLALWAYLGYARRGGAQRYAGVALLFCLGLLAKPMLVTLPLLLLLLDVWPLARVGSGPAQQRPGRLLLEKLPLLALAAGVSILTVLAQQRGGLVVGGSDLPLGPRLANAVHATAWYLVKTAWPVDLAVHYPHPYMPERGGQPLAPQALAAAALLLVGLSALAWRARKRRPELLVGWLWYGVGLVPVSGLVQVSTQGMADRYTYLPLIGIFIALVWGSAGALRTTLPPPQRRSAAALLAGVVLSACGARAWEQTRTWRDSRSLLEHALEVTPSDVLVRVSLGLALQDEGLFEQALPHYREALRHDPRHPLTHFQLGLGYTELGDLARAERHYRAAVQLTPDVAAVRENLAGVLLLQQRPEEAVEHYERAAELRPGSARAQLTLGGALARAGRLEDAAARYRRALALEPGLTEARMRLGHALGALGELDAATREFEVVLAAEPDNPRAQAALALAGRLRAATPAR